jgi:hypothetical protein
MDFVTRTGWVSPTVGIITRGAVLKGWVSDTFFTAIGLRGGVSGVVPVWFNLRVAHSIPCLAWGLDGLIWRAR